MKIEKLLSLLKQKPKRDIAYNTNKNVKPSPHDDLSGCNCSWWV